MPAPYLSDSDMRFLTSPRAGWWWVGTLAVLALSVGFSVANKAWAIPIALLVFVALIVFLAFMTYVVPLAFACVVWVVVKCVDLVVPPDSHDWQSREGLCPWYRPSRRHRERIARENAEAKRLRYRNGRYDRIAPDYVREWNEYMERY